MLFYFIRHADPDYKTDTLKPIGKRQAEAVGRRLASIDFDAVFSSPQGRAMETALPLCEMIGKEPVVLDWAAEKLSAREFRVFSEREQRSVWVFKDPEETARLNAPEVLALGHRWYTHPTFAVPRDKDMNYAEGIARVSAARDAFFANFGYEKLAPGDGYRIAEANNRKKVALFAHAGFGTTFLSLVLDIPYPIFATRALFSFTGVTVIEFPEGGVGETVFPRVLCFSDLSHLYRAGLPISYDNRICP